MTDAVYESVYSSLRRAIVHTSTFSENSLSMRAGLAMYFVTGFGVTVGFHRMLTHRSFRTSKPVEYFFAAAGSMAVQGPVINWVADHRKHHAHTDEEGDPHSPHVGAGKGMKGALRGLLHAHVGWLLTEHGRAERAKYARDLVEDRGMRIVDKGFVGWVLLGLALPAALGWVITGSYNFSRSAQFNAENLLILDSPALAERYSAYLDGLLPRYR